MKAEKAIFGAGCFWGVEDNFISLKGIIKTSVGYSGGQTKNPTYEEVCQKGTGHVEVVYLEYDSEIISFQELIKFFFKIHDPFQKNGQGVDFGSQYRTAIFYFTDNQKEVAEKELKELAQNSGKIPATEITKASEYYEAEDYHQKFLAKRRGEY